MLGVLETLQIYKNKERLYRDKMFVKFTWTGKGIGIAKTIWKKKNKLVGLKIILPNFIFF